MGAPRAVVMCFPFVLQIEELVPCLPRCLLAVLASSTTMTSSKAAKSFLPNSRRRARDVWGNADNANALFYLT